MASEHKYENVQTDDHDEGRSSTEVESLIGDGDGHGDGQGESEKQWRRRGRSKRTSAFSAFFHAYRWVVDTSLLLVILGLLVRDQLRQQGPYGTPSWKWDVGGDFTGVRSEPFPTKLTRFKSDMSYAPMNTSEFFTEEVLQKWNKLMPKGMGFVWVNDTHRYHDLPTPIEWYPGMTVFTTSVTHTLHCLYAIVQTYSGLKSGHPIPDDHHWHMIHCFDYLRNTIMCNADIALEGHETTFPDHNGGSDGWDSTHICRDYDRVKEYLESVRAYDDQLIY